MVIELRPVDFRDIQHWFVDFQKKSRCLEMPPEPAEYVGIFNDTELVGYFILQGFDGKTVEVNQGYLKKEYRHLDLADECIRQMEKCCKKAGYKEIRLGTHNRFRSYLKFMARNGYRPEHLVFHKDL